MNSIDEGIQFTDENTRADGSMPNLDTLVIPNLKAVCLPLYTESQLILTNTCSGTATMP